MWFIACLAFLAVVSGQITVNITRVFPTLTFQNPVDFKHDAASNTFYVVQRTGTIVAIDGATRNTSTVFLDIVDNVVSSGGEQGLLGLALHPNFAQNRQFYVYYTNPGTVVSRFTATNPRAANPATEFILLKFAQPYENHNGGGIGFGPDGYLYIGTGDGGSGGDPQGNGQKTTTFLGKFLRINVDATSTGKNYSIPADNPFVGNSSFLPEIWTYGMRNPWRWSFDRFTGILWAGDVGQGDWEEVSIISKGNNYGWNVMEGTHCYPPGTTTCATAGKVLPIYEYSHTVGQSITGGFVYRGARVPQLYGKYIFADYQVAKLYAMTFDEANLYSNTVTSITYSGGTISSFGTDAQNNVYILDYSNGRIYMFDQLTSYTGPTITPTSAAPSNGGSDTAATDATDSSSYQIIFSAMLLFFCLFA